MNRQTLFSDGANWGFSTDARSFRKAHPIKGPLRLGTRIIDASEHIPAGWEIDPSDRCSIVRMPTMKDLIRSLT